MLGIIEKSIVSYGDKTLVDFEGYQEFVDDMKVYPKEKSIVYPLMALAGEAGECAGKYAKFLREDGPLNKEGIIQELGDCLFFICAAATDLDINLEDVVRINMEKLKSRKKEGTIKGDGDNR